MRPHRTFLRSLSLPAAAGAFLAAMAVAGPQDGSRPTRLRTDGAFRPAPRVPFEREVLPAPVGPVETPGRAVAPGAVQAPVASSPDELDALRRRGAPVGGSTPPFAPFEEVQVLVADGELWARGRTYKASFGEDGATYVPFLGSDAPRSFPLSMELVGARLGEVELDLEAPRVRREGDRIVIDRGPVRAEYVPGLEALEQLFVLEQRAPGAGDLALRIEIETELAPRAAGAGWDFEGPLGGVRYGEVVVLDAGGGRLSLPALVDAHAIELVVPATFLASASFPIAIDPLLSTSTVDGSAPYQLAPDIAWDPFRGRFTVVFEEVFSAGDHDVKIVQTSPFGSPISTLYADFSLVDTREPRVAVLQAARKGLVVYTTGPVGSRRIEGNLLELDFTPTLSPRMLISDNPEGLDLASPDVGGDAYDDVGFTYFTVVWQRIWNDADADIVMRQMGFDGFLQPETLVTNFIDVRDDAPSISNCISPLEDTHNVVWRRDETAIMGAQFLFNGFPIVPEFIVVAFASGFPLSEPSVSALGPSIPGDPRPTYAVAFSVYYSATLDSDVRIYVLAEDQQLTFAQDYRAEHTETYDDQLRPSVATSGSGFAVVYEGAAAAPMAHRSYISSFDLANGQLALRERRVLADASTDDHFVPRICSTWEHGEGAPGFGPYGVVSHVINADDADITFGRYLGGQASGVQYQACYGLPNSSGQRALMTIDGFAGSTTAPRQLRVEGLPANRPGIFFASRTTFVSGVVPTGSSGRLCLRNPTGRFPGTVNTGPSGFAERSIDPTALPLSGGTLPAVAGTTWYFQFWHRDTVAGMPTSNFSNAAGIPFH